MFALYCTAHAWIASAFWKPPNHTTYYTGHRNATSIYQTIILTNTERAKKLRALRLGILNKYTPSPVGCIHSGYNLRSRTNTAQTTAFESFITRHGLDIEPVFFNQVVYRGEYKFETVITVITVVFLFLASHLRTTHQDSKWTKLVAERVSTTISSSNSKD